MNEIKKEFLLGLKQGWTLFWSPFVGFFHALKSLKHTNDKKNHAKHA